VHIATLPSGRYYFDGMDEQQRRAEEDRLNADIRKRISASASPQAPSFTEKSAKNGRRLVATSGALGGVPYVASPAHWVEPLSMEEHLGSRIRSKWRSAVIHQHWLIHLEFTTSCSNRMVMVVG
jgi:hypothetical protein